MWLRLVVLNCLIILVTGCSADDPTRHNTFFPLTAIEVIATYEAMADQTVNQYRAVGDFSGSFTRDITAEVAWRIDNRKIADLSRDAGNYGLVIAVAPGETEITASSGAISGSAPVIVTSAFLTAIEIEPADAELQEGVEQQYTATGTFSDDTNQDISMLASWESSDTGVATIDNSGLATTKAKGSTTISGTWQEIEDSTGLLVTGATLTAVAISPEEAIIAQSTTKEFTAEATFSDDSTRDVTDEVDWQSDDNSVAVVDEQGLATAVAPGTAEITASYDADGTTVSDSAEITVTNAVIESITVTPDNNTINEGENQQFTATGTFSDDSEQDITLLANWLTTDNRVGTISNSPDSQGLFVSIAAGTTIIEATFGRVSGQTDLTVRR